MPVCSYYLRGTCKFGDSCRNEHPKGAFNNPSWTNQNRNGQGNLPFSTESMAKDLTAQMDKPLWPLSSYGPAKGEPNVLAGLDISPDELRVQATSALRGGNVNEYITYESSKIAAAESAYTNARTNIQQAYETATKQSPVGSLLSTTNAPIFNKPTSAFGGTTSSAFGGTKAFGQPVFGQSGFGATPSAFGQPSTSTTTSAFGQSPPSTASTATGAFGQPIHPTSAFGTSTFGQTSQPQPSIVKPASGAFSNFVTGPSGFGGGTGGASGGGFSAFAGKPTAFGQGVTATSGAKFGQPSFGAPSAFGALAQQQQPQASPQSQSAFGTFGQPTTSAFGASTQTTSSAFRTPTQQAQPFGSSTTTAPSAFGITQPTSAFSAFSPSTTTTTSVSPSLQSSLRGTTLQQPPALISLPAFSVSRPSGAVGTKKSATDSPDFDGIIDTGIECVTGTGKNTALFKAGSSPYDAELPTNYAEIMPKKAIEAYKGKKFELGKVPEFVPPLEMR
ncbi:hypothetical protein AX15_000805 [Amanita polypyramis BW_CC]|nr:hypothetical protein AX15_000805 [Amanita polypyramis BW_CC]